MFYLLQEIINNNITLDIRFTTGNIKEEIKTNTKILDQSKNLELLTRLAFTIPFDKVSDSIYNNFKILGLIPRNADYQTFVN